MGLIRRRKALVGCGALVLLLAATLAVGLIGLRSQLFGPEGHYFDSKGARIHYTDEGTGVPVVLLHGLGTTAHAQWRRTGRIDALAKDYRVIALDNRGHGRSGKPHDPGQYGMQMVEDLVRLLDHLKIDRAHVVGYSMGGFITLKLVVTHPDRVLSAAACGAGWEQDTPENRDFAEAVAQAVLKGDPGPLVRRLGVGERQLAFWEKLAVRMSLMYFNDPQALAAVSRGSRHLTLTEAELRSNRVPTLTIIGGDDGLLPDAQALHGHMANHKLVVLPGANHGSAGGAASFLPELEAFMQNSTPKTPT